MRTQTVSKSLLSLAAALALALAGACSTDSPTEPSRPPATPPGGGGGGTGAFSVVVTATPGTVAAGSDDPVVITVRATRDGQPAPNGTLAVVSALEGSFGALGGPGSVTVELTNGQAQVAFFPPVDEEQAVVVQANVAGSVGQTTIEIAGTTTFFVSHVEPSSGSPQGGDTVTVVGSGFEEPVRVLFGGVNAQVLSVNATRIRVRTPPSPGAPTETETVPVEVTINVNEEETATDTVTGAFTYAPGGGDVRQPAIFSVTPTTGNNEGGTRVSIIGEGFQAPVQVEFGGEFGNGAVFLEATVQSVTSGRIEVLSPAAVGFGAELRDQVVAIRITNLNSGLSTTRAEAFRYGNVVQITSVTPNRVPYFGGPLVTIFGSGFDSPVAVGLADWAQPAISVTGTEIVVRTEGIDPGTCQDVTGPVEVVNITTGSGGSGAAFTWLVEAFTPVVFAVNPSNGPQAGGNNVTLRGEFLLTPRVTIGNRPAEVLSVTADATQAVVRAPFLPNEELNEEACDANADGTQGQRFVPTAVNVTVVNAATNCTTTVTNGYVYNPTDSSCRNDVGPPPETEPQCSDGVDNDGDGDTDLDDAECTDGDDNNEAA